MVAGFCTPRKSKIQELGLEISSHEDIGGLQVAVQNVVLM
jgi:hypothetical protein